MFTEIGHDASAAREANQLAAEVETALHRYGKGRHPVAGEIWAYEIDGFGNAIFMDDANVPSLLGLPYLEGCSRTDPAYLATRKFVLSE